MELILDTNFVIAAEREARRGVLGKADAFLAGHETETFFITFTVAGELACGQSAAAMSDGQRLCRPYPVLPWTMEIAWQYGELDRSLAAHGNLIARNSLNFVAFCHAAANGYKWIFNWRGRKTFS